MVDSKQVPEVRFGEFSDNWNAQVIDKIASRYDNLRVPITSSDRVAGTTPYFGANGIQDYVEGYTHDGEYVLVAEDGANDLMNYPVQYVNGKIWVNNHAHVLQGKPSIMDNVFLKLAISKADMKPFLVGGGRAKLNADALMKISVSLPFLINEQTKIGELFKNLDTLINQHQTRVAQLANVKKSMLDKMFPKAAADVPEVRFRGFVERWKSCKFEDTVTFYSGLTYSPNDVQEKPGTLVLRSSNVKRGEIINADNVYVNSEVINCDFVQQGDIVVVVRNGSRSLIGKHAQVKSTIPNTVIGAFMTGIRSKQPSFINALLDTSLFYQEVEKCLGATINQITQGMFKKMHFMIPANENEMALIGNYFQNLDTLMAQNQKALDQLKNLKQALLHKMFV